MIRLGASIGIFALMVGWEALNPKRVQKIARSQRWSVNLGLAALNMVLMRFTIGSLAYMSAVTAAEHGIGLLYIWQLPNTVSIVATFLLLDLAIYCQHIVMHKLPILWRLHKVHHTDIEFDATTAVRFHPLEIFLSMFYKAACIIIIGGNPEAIIAFEMLLNAAATFNHSNIKIPERLDKILRWLIITPDAHRIHHSVEPSETDSNYGFSISCWDRLFNTYNEEPKRSQTTMAIGLKHYRDQGSLGFQDLLRIPFVGDSQTKK